MEFGVGDLTPFPDDGPSFQASHVVDLTRGHINTTSNLIFLRVWDKYMPNQGQVAEIETTARVTLYIGTVDQFVEKAYRLLWIGGLFNHALAKSLLQACEDAQAAWKKIEDQP